MRLLLRFELLRLKGAFRNLFRSPGRAAVGLLVGLCIGVGVFAQWMAPHSSGNRHAAGGEAIAGLFGEHREWLWAFVFTMLLLATYYVLSSGFRGGLLSFGLSDVDFLFPSPIPRRSVLIHRLCLDYLKLALFIGVMMLWLGPQTRLLGARDLGATAPVGLAALLLYLIGVLNVSHLLNLLYTFHAPGMRAAPAALKVSLLLLVVMAVLVPLWQSGPQGWFDRLAELFRSTVVTAVFYPMAITTQALIAPFAGLPDHVGARLFGLLAFAATTFVLLISRRENLYEPSIGIAAWRGEIRAAMRAGDWQAATAARLARRRQRAKHVSFPAFGLGGWALVWKSVALALRSPGRVLLGGLVTVVAPVAGLYVASQYAPVQKFARYVPFVAVYLVWVLSLSTMQWRRAELRRADVLKPLPIPAWRHVLAQVVPLATGLAVWLWLVLGGMLLFVPGSDPRVCLTVGLGLPPMMLLLGLANLAVVTKFPGPQDPVQNFLGGLLLMIALPFLMGPGIGAVALLWTLQAPGWLIGLVAAAVSAALAFPAVLLTAHLYRHYDPTE